MELRREAERFARRYPMERPKWRQYRTDEQERIIADAALTRRNLRAQAKKLGFTGPKAIERMLDAWLPNALEVMGRMEAPEAQAIGIVLERIAVALEKIAEGAGTIAARPAASNGVWKCPVHATAVLQPAGVSRKTGKPYDAFYKCPIQLPDGSWCTERPGRSSANAASAGLTEAQLEEALPKLS